MGKIRYLTVKEYAKGWEKSERAIYQRISAGKLMAIPEPGGGQGKLIPVCDCEDNCFPDRSICIKCKKTIESKISYENV